MNSFEEAQNSCAIITLLFTFFFFVANITLLFTGVLSKSILKRQRLGMSITHGCLYQKVHIHKQTQVCMHTHRAREGI